MDNSRRSRSPAGSVRASCPTLHESGLPDFEALNWQGVLAPAGTPPRIIARLHAELVRIGRGADVDARLRGMGYTPVFSTPAQFAENIRQEIQRWTEIVKAGDLQVQ